MLEMYDLVTAGTTNRAHISRLS